MTTAVESTMVRPSPTARTSDAPIPFGRLLRVEWGKATDTRAARWLIALTAAATLLIMLAPLIAKNSIDQTYATYLQFAMMTLTALLPVVSIMTLTSEWTQRTVLTTFVQEPRRVRVIGAKVTVSGLMALIAIVWGAVVTAAALGIAAATGRGLEADLGAANVLGYVAFVIANIAMGVAFGALLHNTAAAIVLFFVLPTAFGILGAAVTSVGKWIDPGTTFSAMSEGHFHGHVAGIVVTAAVWVVIPLWVGLVRTLKREIK